jgi:hypothetical protein
VKPEDRRITEGLGPDLECDPVPPSVAQKRHAQFWAWVGAMVEDETGDYDDLPRWMTEDSSHQLANN